MTTTSIPKPVFLAGLFLVIFLVYVKSPIITSFDSRWTVPTSMSIYKEGNTDLNEYREVIERDHFYAIEVLNGHYYSMFPVGVSVISLPFVFCIEKTYNFLYACSDKFKKRFDRKEGKNGVKNNQVDMMYIHPEVERIIASIMCAAAAIVMFLMAELSLTRRHALLVLLIFAFCTSMWSTASRALWQHGPSVLMLTVALYLLLQSKKDPHRMQYAAIPLALAFIIRPTNSLSVLVLSIYVLIKSRRIFLKYVLWAAPLAALFFVYNYSVYDVLFPRYFQPNRILDLSHFKEAMFGNLVSPARGVFVFSPVLLLAMAGACKYRNRLKTASLESCLLIIIVLHWLVISSFPHWWAGHSYGARFFTDMMPYFVYFIILYFEKTADEKVWKKVDLRRFALALMIGFSFFVHYQGSHSNDVYVWNGIPQNVDEHPERLWDWSDPQFLR